MKKRVFYSLLLLGLGANLFLGAHVYFSTVQAGGKQDPYQNIDIFMRVLERVRSEYVDGEKVNYDDLFRGAMRGMLSTLDPHSEYLEPIRYDELRNDTEGAYGGVGIQIGLSRDRVLTVLEPMEDSPAAKAGILAGDRIIKIDGKSTERFTAEDAAKRLKGKVGAEVNFTIQRPSTGETKEIALKRAIIKVDTVKDINGHHEYPLLENGVAYVRIRQFGEHTASELEEGLKKSEAKGMKALVIDLRGNPGGLLDQAVKVCEKFLKANTLVVSTEGRASQQKQEYRAEGRKPYLNLPMVLLVNGSSASASEIVAGCLQDLGRAFVLGEQTFGKGSVQSILPLQDGSALKLTTAKYYTPSHKVIHEKGITPDSVVPMSAEEEEALYLKRVPGGLENLDEERRERVKNAHDVQLERASDYLKGVLLFLGRSHGNGKLVLK
ncbi:MAG TPA: S41 family peptidase [Verrucomicrobiae bacterium]|nr:S41 family peptidase [Verrucomicrobiae bacterium]